MVVGILQRLVRWVQPPGVVDTACSGSSKNPVLPDSPGTKGIAKLPQPVAVDGCGGTSPPFVSNQGSAFPVTPTVEWTEKPKIPSRESPSLSVAGLPESTGCCWRHPVTKTAG